MSDCQNIFNQNVLSFSSLQIIAAQEEMLRKERELEEARKKLAQIRQQQYKFLPSELREDNNWWLTLWAVTAGCLWVSVKGTVCVCVWVCVLSKGPPEQVCGPQCLQICCEKYNKPVTPESAVNMVSSKIQLLAGYKYYCVDLTTSWKQQKDGDDLTEELLRPMWSEPECDQNALDKRSHVCQQAALLFVPLTNCISSSHT